MNYKILEHKTDLVIWARGQNLALLLINLAEGMYSVWVGDINLSKSVIKHTNVVSIRVRGDDQESLLVNFLNELIFFTDKNKKLARNIKIKKISNHQLSAEFFSTPLSQPPKLDIKAATFHDLKIKEIGNHLETTVLFDI